VIKLSKLIQIAKNIIPEKHHAKARRIFNRLRTLPNIGAKFYCPCCNALVKEFLPFGAIKRQNAECPYCGALERHRLIRLFLKNETNLFSDRLNVLHFAPENILKDFLVTLPNLNYVTTDLSSPIASVKSDITNTPFEDDAFDVILCSHVLEHVPDDHKAIREMFRILKPGGWAIIQVPIDKKRKYTYEDPSIISPSDRERVFGQFDHLRIYGIDYIDRLESVGFDVTVHDYAKQLGFDMVIKCGLMKDDSIYYCIKPKCNRK